VSIPFSLRDTELTSADFRRLRAALGAAVMSCVPCEAVVFATGREREEARSRAQSLGVADPGLWARGVEEAWDTGRPVRHPAERRLFIPVADRGGKIIAVAVPAGVDAALVQAGPEELTIVADRVAKALREVRWWAVDPLTGLPGLQHLRREIRAMPPAEAAFLFLVEVPPRSGSVDDHIRHAGRVAAYLESLFDGSAHVHSLGNGVFGFLWPGGDADEARKLGYYLLRKLKRQARAGVHIGVADIRQDRRGTDPDAGAVSTAWKALAKARERGPYAFCAADDDETFPLVPPAPEVMEALRRRWRRLRLFSVALVRKDIGSDVPDRVRALFEGRAFFETAEGCFVLLPGLDTDDALNWASDLQAGITALGAGTFSIGIASYPCPGFTKADVPLNAQKALLHAGFLGHGAVVALDGVTLNISGDAYYNAGDLNRAIKEYSRGLNLAPRNANLLNSLGVIYAQIDRYDKAIPLFERAVAVDGRDFMALYNLGSAHLQRGEPEAAARYFEKAMAVDDGFFELLLQLGQLYCAQGRYKKAARLLTKAERLAHRRPDGGANPWERCEPWLDVDGELGHGLLWRPLAEAHAGMGDRRRAMMYFERAVAYNERDDQALAMLGELYVLEGEGADIAVSLCRRAVALDETNAGNWRRLALALRAAGDSGEARHALERCLSLAPKDVGAMMLLAAIHEETGRLRKAAALYEKILSFDGTNRKAAARLKKLNKG